MRLINLSDKIYEVLPAGIIRVRYFNPNGRLCRRGVKPGKTWDEVWKAYIEEGGKVSSHPMPWVSIPSLQGGPQKPSSFETPADE